MFASGVRHRVRLCYPRADSRKTCRLIPGDNRHMSSHDPYCPSAKRAADDAREVFHVKHSPSLIVVKGGVTGAAPDCPGRTCPRRRPGLNRVRLSRPDHQGERAMARRQATPRPGQMFHVKHFHTFNNAIGRPSRTGEERAGAEREQPPGGPGIFRRLMTLGKCFT